MAPYIGSSPAESALTTGDLADDIVTLAKLAGGTDGNVISFDASGNPVAIATGNDGQVLTSAGAGQPPAFEAVSAGVATTLTAEQATTSGSSVTFGSIPTGCFKIEVLFENVSHNTADATNFHSIQLGDSGGIEASSYVGGSHGFVTTQTRTNSTSTSGFAIDSNYGAAVAFRGFLTLILKDSTNNTWVASGAMGGANDMTVAFWGTKSLSAELTQVKFLTPDTLDLGDIAIRYYV